jgi:hypothetical protein
MVVFMRKLLVSALTDEERRMIIDSIKSKTNCDIHSIMLGEMLELLDDIFTGEITVSQLRSLFATKLLDIKEIATNDNIITG